MCSDRGDRIPAGGTASAPPLRGITSEQALLWTGPRERLAEFVEAFASEVTQHHGLIPLLGIGKPAARRIERMAIANQIR